MRTEKIYSLNKLAFLISKDVDIELHQDIQEDKRKIYGIVKNDVTDILFEYNTDIKLHSFLTAFGILRKRIKELK